MREFVYFSKSAVTSGNLIKENLMKAGRIDILCHFVIQGLFISHGIRDDTKLHLVLNGAPDPPKHLEIFPGENFQNTENKIEISKKDIAGLIKRMLYKYRKGQRTEIAPGYSIEKKSFVKLIEELKSKGKDIYLLDKSGEDLRKIKISGDEVFVLGDYEGIPKQELKRAKHLGLKKISVGPHTLFTSQVITLIHNEIDRRPQNNRPEE